MNTAYRQFGFIHNDLYPWNIMLKTYDKEMLVGYRYSGKQFSFKVTKVPVIIDYGKANIIINDNYCQRSYGSMELQDIVSIMVSSANILTVKHHLNQKDSKKFITFMNYIALTKYTGYKKFTSIRDIKNFTFFAKKYDNMINSDKGELAQNALSSFINFMLVNFYDDLYLTATTKYYPVLNIDDIIFLPTIDINLMQQQGNDNLIHKKLFENVENRVDKFLSKDIMFSKQTNCLQFTKYYQNMWRSMRYIENMVHDIGSIVVCTNEKKTNIMNLTKKIQFCYEKLLNSWDKQSAIINQLLNF